MSQKVADIYLNDAVLMMFAEPVNPAFRSDAMDASLYAQLAASKKFNKFTHYREWQTTLIDALTTFGWLRLDLMDNQGGESEVFVVSDVLRTLLPHSLESPNGGKLEKLIAWLSTTEAGQVARAMVQRVDSAASPEADTLTRTPTAPPVYSVVLQVAVLLPSRQQVLLCVAFETQQSIGPNLFDQRWLKGQLVGDVKTSAFVGMLDELRYAQYRERVDAALSDKRAVLSFRVKGISS